MDRLKTQRGFDIYGRITDSRNQVIRVQESSEITIEGKDAGPWAWVFVDLDGNGKQSPHHLGECNPCSAYLSKEQARELAEALLLFADEV